MTRKIPKVNRPNPNAFGKDPVLSVDKILFGGWQPTLDRIKAGVKR